jgi:membrane associated rhomboid family serine protease
MNQFRPTGFNVLPLVIKNLLIINALFFLAQNTLNGPSVDFSFENTFALHAFQSDLFKPWQLFTHMFLHGGLGHIFGNMLALWMFGAILENMWGPKMFARWAHVGGAVVGFILVFFLKRKHNRY